MSAATNLPASRRLEQWEKDMAEVRAEVERAMQDLVTEDDTPVDNILSEKQQRLLTEPLYDSWPGPEECASGHRGFMAMSNVGLFYALHEPPLVPDMMLALDVPGLGPDLSQKANRSYFVWHQGKPPAVAIEVVSNREGSEDGDKMRKYATAGVSYYAIFDPWRQLSQRVLRVYQLVGRTYVEQAGAMLGDVGLGLTLWQGDYEGENALWLRWADREGRLIATGSERAEQERQRAEQERQRAEQERQRAEQERQRAEQERQRAERLMAKLRESGIEPPD